MDKKTFLDFTPENSYEKEVFQVSNPVFVNFCVEWCPPCKILSKILGVNSIILVQHDSKFEKISFNSPPDNFYLQLHFIALQQNYMFQIHVLIANIHGYEDQFNIYYQCSSQKNNLSVINTNYINTSSNESKRINPQSYDYFAELSNTYNAIFYDIHNSLLSRNSSNYSLANLNSKISQLKMIEEKINIHEIIQNNKPIEFETNTIKECFMICEYCCGVNPDYCNKIGCYFHEKCLELLFQE